jgi:MFS family permease
VLLAVREPPRQGGAVTATAQELGRRSAWLVAAPIYIVVAAASFVDNAVGAWSPSLLIRSFHQDPGRIGVELGALLTIGFGAGVIAGGFLADRAGARAGLTGKIRTALIIGALILPAALLMNAPSFTIALLSVPLYFALSGAVTSLGFSAILDTVKATERGLAMSVSFFLNVAIGAGLGPTAVALAAAHVFGESAGLGPALSATVIAGYACAVLAAAVALGWNARAARAA